MRPQHPVLYQGRAVIGHASSERGARAVHVRVIGRPSRHERVVVRLAECIDEDAMLVAHEQGETYRGPLAWFVGRQLRTAS